MPRRIRRRRAVATGEDQFHAQFTKCTYLRFARSRHGFFEFCVLEKKFPFRGAEHSGEQMASLGFRHGGDFRTFLGPHKSVLLRREDDVSPSRALPKKDPEPRGPGGKPRAPWGSLPPQRSGGRGPGRG